MFFALFNPTLFSLIGISIISYPFLPAVFILLSSLIAAFSINKSVINTQEIKNDEKNREKERSIKILRIGKSFLLKELAIQKDFFNNLELEINSSSKELKELETNKYFYTHETNENKIISQIDYLLKIELHNYTKDNVISILFDIKGDVINIIHYVNVLKSMYIPVNDKDNSLCIIKEISDLLVDINNKINSINI